MTQLKGKSLIGSREGTAAGKLHATDPTTGQTLEPAFAPATDQELEQAVRLASEAFATYSRTTGSERAAFLRKIAANIAPYFHPKLKPIAASAAPAYFGPNASDDQTDASDSSVQSAESLEQYRLEFARLRTGLALDPDSARAQTWPATLLNVFAASGLLTRAIAPAAAQPDADAAILVDEFDAGVF